MTRQQVDKLLRYWQARLRLLDWRIRLEYKHRGPKDRFLGDTTMWPRLKCATIFIAKRRPRDRNNDPIEVVVIHELIHLHLVTWQPRKMDRRREFAFEASVDSLAWGLYKTRYPAAGDPHIGK